MENELNKEYLYLPERFWRKHKQCELFVGQIEEFIINDIYNDLRYQTLESDSTNDINEGEHIFDYLLRKEKFEEHDKLIRKSLVSGLLMDTCYFLQEALSCSKKKRLTVTFSLLRKPFVFHLPVYLRILFDSDFLEQFNNQDLFDVNKITEDDKKLLIKKSLPLLLCAKTLTEEEIYDWIFNQKEQDSLINLSNKALHLSTTRNKNNETGIQNLNFIFANQNDIENLWAFLYQRLPILLLYFVEIIDPLILTQIDFPSGAFEKRIEERIVIITNNVW